MLTPANSLTAQTRWFGALAASLILAIVLLLSFGSEGEAFASSERAHSGSTEPLSGAEGRRDASRKKLARLARRSASRRHGRTRRPQPAPAPAPAPTPAPAPKPAPTAAPTPAPTPQPAPAPTPAPTPAPQPAPAPAPQPAPAPAPAPAPPPPPPAPAPAPLLTTGFEEGLRGWNTAGVGDVAPTVVTDIVRSGTKSARVALSGSQERSELIFGGNGGGSTTGIVRLNPGDTRYFAFSVNVQTMTYGKPGAHNLIMQLKSDNEGSPRLGLMLWDYQGKRGLWSHGEAMGGDRFLAPIPHGQWQDLVVAVYVSPNGDGWYRVYLGGQQIDERKGVNVLRSGATFGYLKAGLYRNGSTLPGPSELRLDAARFGTSLASVAG